MWASVKTCRTRKLVLHFQNDTATTSQSGGREMRYNRWSCQMISFTFILFFKAFQIQINSIVPYFCMAILTESLEKSFSTMIFTWKIWCKNRTKISVIYRFKSKFLSILKWPVDKMIFRFNKYCKDSYKLLLLETFLRRVRTLSHSMTGIRLYRTGLRNHLKNVSSNNNKYW